MSDCYYKFIDYILPSESSDVIRRRMSLSVSLILLAAPMCLLLGLLSLYYSGISASITAFNNPILGILSLILLRTTGKYNLMVGLYIGINILMMVGQILYLEETLYNASIPWLVAIPILLSFIVSYKHTLFWTLISLIIVVGLYIHVNSGDIEILTSLMCAITLMGGCGALYTYRMEQLIEQNQNQKEKAETLFRIICHDMNNQLAKASGSMEILNSLSSFEGKAGRFASILTDSLTRAIDQLNELKILEAHNVGKLVADLKSVSLKRVFDELESYYSDRLKKKQIKLIIDVDSKVLIQADTPLLMHQILGNLLTNAIKFSKAEGRIWISARAFEKTVAISFADEGIGMSLELQEKIFDSASVTTRKGTAGELGTGFGMPIVKATVEGSNGHISVESFEGKGTTFTLTFQRGVPADLAS